MSMFLRTSMSNNERDAVYYYLNYSKDRSERSKELRISAIAKIVSNYSK